MNVSVIIITLNEAEAIGRVIEEVPKDSVSEILVVDGNSTAGTPDVVRRLGHKVINQEGKGYGDAFMTGARHASGDTLVLMDGDGSQDPKYIPALLEEIRAGKKAVFASRYMKGAGSADDTLIRYIGNRFFTFLTNALHGVGISDSLFLFAAIDKKVFGGLGLKQAGFEFCVEVPIKVRKTGHEFAQIPSKERKRFHGVSRFNAFSLGIKILKFIIKERFSC